jgi:hypothetical protein
MPNTRSPGCFSSLFDPWRPGFFSRFERSMLTSTLTIVVLGCCVVAVAVFAFGLWETLRQ